MARQSQEYIDTFIGITGASEAVALRRLEEHGDDLNRAIDAYFNEGDVTGSHSVPIPQPQEDFMVIDDPAPTETARFPHSLLFEPQNLNPFSLLDQPFGRRFFDVHRGADFSGQTPFVTHPRELREIPIEVNDGNNLSSQSGSSMPRIEEVNGSSFMQGHEIHGKVVMEGEDEEEDPLNDANINQNRVKNDLTNGFSGPSAPQLNILSDDNNDIEEEMLRAAIEASKREAEVGFSSRCIEDSSTSLFERSSSHLVDAEMVHAVSLSPEAAEQEKALREGKIVDGTTEPAPSAAVVQEFGRNPLTNGRQGLGFGDKEFFSKRKWDAGSSFVHEDAEDEDVEPLVRNTSRRTAIGSVEPSGEDRLSVEGVPSSPEAKQDFNTASRSSSDAFQSDEWAGITSEEQEEAYMLEAAMFGVMPEDAAYRFGYPQQGASYPWPDRRPPSPTLTAQRLLREQQDDEYLASLQADREKELKAKEEAEAALMQEKHEEEEARRRLLEKEEFERQLATKEASLPQEPALDDENAVTLLVRMPNGSRLGRRFRKCDKLQALFDYIDVARVVKPGTYKLVRPFPRRAYSIGENDLSLSDLGLSSKQEALFMELI